MTPPADPGRSALLTDLYELTMMRAYAAEGMAGIASFELFFRALPPSRGFLMAAGLEQALEYLENLRFEPEEIEWLATTGRFPPEFLRSLETLRFTGDVDAMPEGTVFFADEPVLRITAPIAQAQLVESRVLNLVHFQTLVASKAARCVLAAGGRTLVDFGLRRSHGAEAALLSARATRIAGFDATATTLAGMRYGIPVVGTMAHSYVQAHFDEARAFEAFARAYPDGTVLLIDTWDTEEGARTAARVANAMRAQGVQLGGVRLDSGDLAKHAFEVRAILDEAGFPDARILASGNLDERRVAALRASGAPIDVYCVGTRVNTSEDCAFLDCAYKLVEYDGRACRKRSEGKATWPGRKQVWRRLDAAGRIECDTLGTGDEPAPKGEPLLAPAMRAGRRVAAAEPLDAIRARAKASLASLPDGLRALDPVGKAKVEVSEALLALTREVDARQGRG